MAQDKFIKKHQDVLEKMREQVRSEKEDILKKIDIDKVIENPKKHLFGIAQDYYNGKSKFIKKAISSGKKLGSKMLKDINNDKSKI